METRLIKFGEPGYPYQKDYGPRWMAANGDHVGCHPGTTIALGTPADAATRQMRMLAHKSFDRLWKGPAAIMSRGQAYKALSASLYGYKKAHIGSSDIEQCKRIIDWADLRLIEKRFKHG